MRFIMWRVIGFEFKKFKSTENTKNYKQELQTIINF
jgi:hypothetical protein